MHDLSFFRANLDSIAQRLATRGYQLEVEQFRALDAERRAALTAAEQLKAQKNEKGDQITALDEKAKSADESFRELMAGVPNIPHESVPVGKSEADNVELRRWG